MQKQKSVTDCEDRVVRGVWEPPWDTGYCITALELRAVYLVLNAFIQFICGRHVLVRTDSFTTSTIMGHKISVCVWQECWIARQVFCLERSWQQHLKRFLFVHSERSASIQPYILHPPLFFPRLLSLLLHPAKEENWTPTHVHTLSTHSWRT